MKLVRCTAAPSQVDDLVAGLEHFDISQITITCGSGCRWTQPRRVVYRGVEYALPLTQTAVVEITACDDAVEGIIQTILDRCNPGRYDEDGRILVIPIEEWYTIRHRQIA